MNNFRKNIVLDAFEKLDRDKDGIILISDIKKIFDAKNHPDVRSGRVSEDEVLGEFLETFEIHHNLKSNARD